MPKKDSTFPEDFKKFQIKIHNFVVNHNFAAKTKEYVDMFNTMASIAPDDMKHYIEKSPFFLEARNKTMAMMERVVELHLNLEEIFKLDEKALGKRFNYDLANVDQQIAQDLKEAANLLKKIDMISEEGRKEIEKIDNPFFAQAHS